MNMRELLLKALELDEFNLAVVNEIKGNPSKITFYSNRGEVLLVVLISASMEKETLNIAPSQLKMVSQVERLNVLSEILDIEMLDKAEDNCILISESDDSVARINFINKFGEMNKFQINIKKVLEVAHD